MPDKSLRTWRHPISPRELIFGPHPNTGIVQADADKRFRICFLKTWKRRVLFIQSHQQKMRDAFEISFVESRLKFWKLSAGQLYEHCKPTSYIQMSDKSSRLLLNKTCHARLIIHLSNSSLSCHNLSKNRLTAEVNDGKEDEKYDWNGCRRVSPICTAYIGTP